MVKVVRQRRVNISQSQMRKGTDDLLRAEALKKVFGDDVLHADASSLDAGATAADRGINVDMFGGDGGRGDHAGLALRE